MNKGQKAFIDNLRFMGLNLMADSIQFEDEINDKPTNQKQNGKTKSN